MNIQNKNAKNKKVKAVIFDFNGTLIYDSPIHCQVWREFVPANGGGEVTDEDLEKRVLGRDNAQILTDFFGELTDRQIEQMSYEKEAEYRRRCRISDTFRLVDGAAEFLDWLKDQGYPITIATGSEVRNVNFYFESPELGLTKWFDRNKVVYDDGSFVGKPEPEIYLRAAAAIGQKCEDCIVFEDSLSGVLAARRAGAAYVVALGLGAAKEKFIDVGGVDLAVEDFCDFRKFPGFGND
ncbi:MAG: HAD family phosphatase [Clostridia bacterium]|nr:HAD family phosphatase [Clostridia bacterium]